MNMPSNYYSILKKILALRYPEYSYMLKRIDTSSLSLADRDKLVDIVVSELCALGLAADGEPTAYGKDLDNLISALLAL